eukprot:1698517-Rhodomonas_salina.3
MYESVELCATTPSTSRVRAPVSGSSIRDVSTGHRLANASPRDAPTGLGEALGAPHARSAPPSHTVCARMQASTSALGAVRARVAWYRHTRNQYRIARSGPVGRQPERSLPGSPPQNLPSSVLSQYRTSRIAELRQYRVPRARGAMSVPDIAYRGAMSVPVMAY